MWLLLVVVIVDSVVQTDRFGTAVRNLLNMTEKPAAGLRLVHLNPNKSDPCHRSKRMTRIKNVSHKLACAHPRSHAHTHKTHKRQRRRDEGGESEP
ncbi:hypothetical protein FQN60_011772 [Etheostoma spectabile]|uniref:Secreted protein n=1 Tax=Etheostoma spectabile TaxID=54343 RepID=A0A5J5DMI1_9PERO|nr:hypothetical protein FQN60_011772 [Etheostoma spectabile]